MRGIPPVALFLAVSAGGLTLWQIGHPTAISAQPADKPQRSEKARPPKGYDFDLKALAPLTKGGLYLGKYEMGLYPDGNNEMPEAYRKTGERLAASIRPLDTSGKPDAKNGKILLLSVGHSNGRYYFGALEDKLRQNASELHPRFEFINAAVPGAGLLRMKNWQTEPPQSKSWLRAKELTSRAGYSPLQVQALLFIATDSPAHPKALLPQPQFPKQIEEMQRNLGMVLARFAKDFPNLKIAYLMSDGLRHYSGVEPYAYQEGFAVKWLIESQIKKQPGTAFEGKSRKLPWLAWGPYIWDNSWDESYFLDGTHAAPMARAVFVEKTWQLFTSDSVAKPWFLRESTKGVDR